MLRLRSGLFYPLDQVFGSGGNFYLENAGRTGGEIEQRESARAKNFTPSYPLGIPPKEIEVASSAEL